MKKIAFMFAAAALFAACTNTEKPATEGEQNDSTVVETPAVPTLTAEDSAAIAAQFEGLEVADSVLQAAYDSLLATKAAVVEEAAEVVEEAAEAVEAAAE